MKWFKKLQEKRNNTSNKIGTALFGEFWNNVKGRSAVLLLFWIIFIALVISFINTNKVVKKDNNVIETKVEYPSIDSYFDNLSSDYSFNITIYNFDDSAFTYFNGQVNNDIITGTKSKMDDEVNYVIRDGIIHDSLSNEVINNLYEDYLTNFFNLNSIYEFIKDKTPVISYDNDLKVYQYDEVYNNQNINFVIKTDTNSITYIEYTYSNYRYIVNII